MSLDGKSFSVSGVDMLIMIELDYRVTISRRMNVNESNFQRLQLKRWHPEGSIMPRFRIRCHLPLDRLF
jgi:hypothetical protein